MNEETSGVRAQLGSATEADKLKAVQLADVDAEERLQMMIENAREYAIFSTDLERTVTSWNSGAERLLGYLEQDIIGHKVDLIFTPEDRASGAPQIETQIALCHLNASNERWHQRKDGTQIWGNGTLMTLRDPTGQAIGFLKIFRDQTESRRLEEKLEESHKKLLAALHEASRARAEAEAAGQAKDRFLAILSHELRTPLTPILMVVETLALNNDSSEETLQALEIIRRNVQLQAHFIDELLDFAHIMQSKVELVLEQLDLREVLQRSIENSEPEIRRKNQRLSVSLEAIDHRLIGDSSRLQQAFCNLLKNASKFTPAEGEIKIHSYNETNWIVVHIIDTGIGIESENIPHIFDAFIQADTAVTRQFGGLGLGLAIAKAMVEAQEGRLTAESRGPGQGSKFIVELPRGNPPPGPAKASPMSLVALRI